MSLFGMYNYDKAGSGVSKDARKKNDFFRFWELYFRKFGKMICLNLLTFVFCIPIVTIGPALAGMTRVLKSYTLEKNAFIFHDFIKGFKQNLKQSIPVGLLDILFTVSAVAALNVYPAMANNAVSGGKIYIVLCVLSVAFALTLLMMNFYIMPMIVATDLKLKDIIKNSFYLTCVALKKNIVTLLAILAVLAVSALLTITNIYTLLLIPFFPISFLGFVVVFNSYPQIQKYVINPYYESRGEDNPEYDYLKPLDVEDAVFEDKGGEEQPVVPQENSKIKDKKEKHYKNKTIS